MSINSLLMTRRIVLLKGSESCRAKRSTILPTARQLAVSFEKSTTRSGEKRDQIKDDKPVHTKL